jgi:pimeloyl-ACP methyl ester carboxylesterase
MHIIWLLKRPRCRLTIPSGRLFALLLTLAVALIGLHGIAPASSAAAQAAPDDVHAPDMAEGFTPGVIDWQPCPENAALECGTLTLPVDYQQPHGETFDMAVIRAKALQASARLGVLFAHPGIHLPGVDFLLSSLDVPALQRLRERFDIVSLDPRGAGRTRQLDCGLDLPGLPTDQSNAALRAYFDDYGRRVAAQCLDQDRDFVLSISSNTFARDIEMFRRALGEHQLNFGMISNSGPVAAVYATLFPRHVRAMLIDSTVAPEFHDYVIERWGEESASYDLALRRVDHLCRHDTSCPLRETGVVAAFDTVFARLLTTPVTLPNGAPFTARDLSDTFFNLLPVEPLWPRIPGALAQALAGDFTRLVPFQSPPSTAGDGLIARSCNDYGTRRPAAEYFPLVAAVGETYPRIFGRLTLASFTALCSAWPDADPPRIRNVQRHLDVPILLLGSEFDPEAPFAWTQRLAQALGMEQHVVRYQGGGHGLAQRSDLPCISEVIDTYLFDLRLPPAGYTCPAVSPVSAFQQ